MTEPAAAVTAVTFLEGGPRRVEVQTSGGHFTRACLSGPHPLSALACVAAHMMRIEHQPLPLTRRLGLYRQRLDAPTRGEGRRHLSWSVESPWAGPVTFRAALSLDEVAGSALYMVSPVTSSVGMWATAGGVALLAKDFRTANNLAGGIIGPAIVLVMVGMLVLSGAVLRPLALALLFALGALALARAALRSATFERLLD